MKRKSFMAAVCLALVLLLLPVETGVSASASTTHTVEKGDTLWRIAVTYQVGLSEIKEANTQIKNYDLIYPGQKIKIPKNDGTVLTFEEEVVRLVNQERTSRGLTPLTQNWELARVARYKSRDIKDNGYFSHTSPVYGTPFQMIKNFGITYRTAGENIAKGYTSPKAVVDGWMASPGHRANILNGTFRQIGVGYVEGGHYWTQMFIG